MIKSIRRKFHNLSIQNKMLLSFLTICVICYSTLFFIGIPQLTKNAKENIIYSADQAQGQSQEYIAFMMDSLRQTCHAFAYDEKVIEIISKDKTAYSFTEQNLDIQTLENHIRKSKNSHYKTVSNIKLYIKEDYSYISEHSEPFLSYSLIEDSEWYKALNQSKCAYYLIPPSWNNSSKYISVVHLISHPEDYSMFIGALVIDTPVKSIESILKKCAVTENSYAYLVNDEGIVVCSSTENPTLVHENRLPTKYSPTLHYSDENNLYSFYRLDTCRWTLVQVIPNNDISEISFNSIKYYIIIGFIMLMLSILLSFKISSSITKRINMLSRTMRNFRYEKTQTLPVVQFGDDIDYLLSSYNQLISDFDALTTENIQNSQRLNETELALLHSQIKPHFLYNTLDMIRFLAEHDQPQKASLAISALSKFYKSGIGNKTLWSTLNNEINHIRCYMEIQKLRYGNHINLIIQIPEEYLDINLPRITLQPIVENSLIHGILGKTDKAGTITICAHQTETSDLHITIKDNGHGLSQDSLSKLSDLSQNGTGIGLWNTNERIRLHYGNSYGLSVRSVLEEYTEITIRIPILRGKELLYDNLNCR